MSKNSNLLNIGKAATLFVGLLLLANNPVTASGFAVNDQSVTYLGNAYAGTSSAAQDASTSYYNPAGMTELKYNQLVVSGTYIKQNIKLYNATATNSDEGVFTGNNPCKPETKSIIPAGHFTWRVSKKFALGLSVVEPFRLDTKYSYNDIASLMATENKITTIDISPTIAYKFNRKFSVGAGLDFLKTNTLISSRLDIGGVGSEAGGYVINSASNWTIGYHVGVLYKPIANTKIGLVYFSRFSPHFRGSTQQFHAQNFFNATQVTYNLRLPDRINFGVTQRFTNRWKAMGELEWTHWSRFKTLNMNYNSRARPGLKSFYYQNSWRVSLGTDYKITPRCTLKGGVAYDQSPTNDIYRNAMLPDSNRVLLALGARYTFTKYISAVAGYSHIFFQKTSIHESGPISNLNSSLTLPDTSTLNASVKNYGNIFGLQLVWTFA